MGIIQTSGLRTGSWGQYVSCEAPPGDGIQKCDVLVNLQLEHCVVFLVLSRHIKKILLY